MSRTHTLGAATALTAAAMLVISSVALAGPGNGFGKGWERGGWDTRTVGDSGSDVYDFTAQSTKDKVIAKGGDDTVLTGDKRDLVRGGNGADIIDGGAGPDKLVGGRGPDTITGGDGRDFVKGGPGNDTIYVDGDDVRDWVWCGPGDDTVYADTEGESRDRLIGCENVNPPVGP